MSTSLTEAETQQKKCCFCLLWGPICFYLFFARLFVPAIWDVFRCNLSLCKWKMNSLIHWLNWPQCLQTKVMLCAVREPHKLLLLTDVHWLLKPLHKPTDKQDVIRLVFLQFSWDLPSLQNLKQTQYILHLSYKYSVEFIGNKTLHCTQYPFLFLPSSIVFFFFFNRRSFINLVQPRRSAPLCLFFLKGISSVMVKW